MDNENKNQNLVDDLDIENEMKDEENEYYLDNKDNDGGSDDDSEVTITKEFLTDISQPNQIKNETVKLSKSKIVVIKKLLQNVKENNNQIIELLSGLVSEKDERIAIGQLGEAKGAEQGVEAGGKVVEGVFDGENMIGPDGKQYSVPANYASKSKLVEGDILKLTITVAGTFIYKQIGPIERVRVVGNLEKDSEGRFFVKSDDRRWRILPASITYFRGDLGDEVVVLIPKTGESQWGAVENIIKNVGK